MMDYTRNNDTWTTFNPITLTSPYETTSRIYNEFQMTPEYPWLYNNGSPDGYSCCKAKSRLKLKLKITTLLLR